jgi:hypothetical protein
MEGDSGALRTYECIVLTWDTGHYTNFSFLFVEFMDVAS